jgi:hypothetical protein
MLSDEDNPIVLPEGITRRTEAGCIEIFENIMSDDIAKKLISVFEDSHINEECPAEYQEARIGGENIVGGEYRSNSVMSIQGHTDISGFNVCSCKMDEAENFLRSIFIPCVNFYQLKYDIEVAFDEGLQLLKYGPGKEYKPHADAGPGVSGRVLSGIIFLNPSDYEGGSTYFINFNYNLKTSGPSIALFPSNYAYTHRAKAVFSGTKYAIVTWMWAPWSGQPDG